MNLYSEIKNQVHDASGVTNPNLYYWAKDSNGVFYPSQVISDNEVIVECKRFLQTIYLKVDSNAQDTILTLIDNLSDIEEG